MQSRAKLIRHRFALGDSLNCFGAYARIFRSQETVCVFMPYSGRLPKSRFCRFIC